LSGESTGASARAGSPDAGVRVEPRSIRVRDLSKRYGSNLILSGIDLAIAPGELLALLGPSGSGKTTLLRVIAGLDTITSGSLLFDAEDATAFTIQQSRRFRLSELCALSPYDGL
jgi:sulfate transport system ATP-binding protein